MRASRLVGLAAAICGCAADRYGAYFHLTAAEEFDHVEFVFGGLMPSDACDGTLDPGSPVVRKTPKFDNAFPAPGDAIFRRQFAADDVRDIKATKEFTYYVPDDENDPSMPLPFGDDLGATVVVIAQSTTATSATPLVGELDQFSVPTDRVDKYEIPLDHPAAMQGELERWGDGPERCLRYTRTTNTSGQSVRASKFIVPTWDRDCDGFVNQPCYAAGGPIADDCDPLRYCDVSSIDPNACAVLGGCTVATANGCELAVCTNQAGHLTKLCGAGAGVCVDDLACTSPPACDRPFPQCLALDLPADITCDVPVLKLTRDEIKEGTLCTDGVHITTPLLTNQVTTVSCMVAEAVPVLATRAFGVTFQTPPIVNGCDLDITINNTPPPGFLPETRLLVKVSTGLLRDGTVVVEVQPQPVDDCNSAPPPVCQPTEPTVHTCSP